MEPLTLGALAGFGIAIPVGAHRGADRADRHQTRLPLRGQRRSRSSHRRPAVRRLGGDRRYERCGLDYFGPAAAALGQRRRPDHDRGLRTPPCPRTTSCPPGSAPSTRSVHGDLRAVPGTDGRQSAHGGVLRERPAGHRTRDRPHRHPSSRVRTGAFVASLSWQTLLAATGAISRTKLPRRFRTVLSIAGNLLVLTIAALFVVR